MTPRRSTATVTAAEEQAYADAFARATTRPFPDLLDARKTIGRLAECAHWHGDTTGWLHRFVRTLEEELETAYPAEWELALPEVAVTEAALVHVPPEQTVPGCPLCRAYQGSHAVRRRPPAAPPPSRQPAGSDRPGRVGHPGRRATRAGTRPAAAPARGAR